MPTTVVRSIGTSSRDYSTLQAWEDAAPANLVTADQIWRGECYNDSEFSSAGTTLSVNGSVTDATRYKELTTATGQSFADNVNKLTNALRYNQANGVGITSTGSYGNSISASESFFRISKLQSLGTGANSCPPFSGGISTVVSNCIFEGPMTSSPSTALVNVTTNCTFTNCLIVGRRSSIGNMVQTGAGNNTYINCTLVVPSDLTAAAIGFKNDYGTATIINCAVFGCTNPQKAAGVNGGVFNKTNCYTNATFTGWTTVAYDTSTGSGFENITNATRDYRLKSTSALIGAGTSVGAPSTDIVGTPRS